LEPRVVKREITKEALIPGGKASVERGPLVEPDVPIFHLRGLGGSVALAVNKVRISHVLLLVAFVFKEAPLLGTRDVQRVLERGQSKKRLNED